MLEVRRVLDALKVLRNSGDDMVGNYQNGKWEQEYERQILMNTS